MSRDIWWGSTEIEGKRNNKIAWQHLDIKYTSRAAGIEYGVTDILLFGQSSVIKFSQARKIIYDNNETDAITL